MSRLRTIAGRAAVIVALWACGALRAELAWESTEVVLEVPPNQSEVKAVFRFRHEGPGTLRMVSEKTSCHCTTAELAKRTYTPGEGGEIVATLTGVEAAGRLSRTIEVRYEIDGKPGLAMLTLTAVTPEYVQIESSSVFWRPDEAREPRTIRFKVVAKEPIHLVDAAADNGAFAVDLQPGGKPGSYLLTVTPPAAGGAQQTRIVVRTDWPADDPLVYKVYARTVSGASASATVNRQRWRDTLVRLLF